MDIEENYDNKSEIQSLFGSDEEIVEQEINVEQATPADNNDGVQPSFMLGAADMHIDVTGIPVTTYGHYLKSIRERYNIKLSDLSEMTRLQKSYIEAIEAEDLDSLPPLVYVLAYIKKLCSCYSIPEEIVQEITADIQLHLKYESPEDPLKDLELSTENPIILKRVLIIGALCILLFIGLIGSLIFLAIDSNQEPVEGGELESTINESQLKLLNGKIELKMNELQQKNTL